MSIALLICVLAVCNCVDGITTTTSTTDLHSSNTSTITSPTDVFYPNASAYSHEVEVDTCFTHTFDGVCALVGNVSNVTFAVISNDTAMHAHLVCVDQEKAHVNHDSTHTYFQLVDRLYASSSLAAPKEDGARVRRTPYRRSFASIFEISCDTWLQNLARPQ